MKPSRSNNHRNKRGASRPPELSRSFEKERLSISRQMEEMRALSREITATTLKMEKWLEALTNLSNAIENKNMLRDVIGTRSEWKPKPNSSSTGKTGNQAFLRKKDSPPGDSKPTHPTSGGKEGAKPSSSSTDGKGSPPSEGHKPFSKDGDSLYDLINAPGMTTIVDNVMKTRKNRSAGRKKQN